MSSFVVCWALTLSLKISLKDFFKFGLFEIMISGNYLLWLEITSIKLRLQNFGKFWKIDFFYLNVFNFCLCFKNWSFRTVFFRRRTHWWQFYIICSDLIISNVNILLYSGKFDLFEFKVKNKLRWQITEVSKN